MAIVQLRLLGGLEVRNAQGEVIDLSVKKVMALLAYLAVQPEQQFQREQLAKLLWPNTANKHSRHSLRQALADLRKHLPEFDKVFRVSYKTIDIITGTIAVDVLDYTDATKQHDLESQEKAFDLYHGQFLDGFVIRSEPFSIWQEEIALNLYQRYIQVVEFLAEHSLLRGNNLKAIELNNKLVTLDPLRESAHRCLMSLYAKLGQHEAVENQYQHCCDVLRDKLKTEPEERTQSCYQRLRQQFEPDNSLEEKKNADSVTLIAPEQSGRNIERMTIRSLLQTFKTNKAGYCVLLSGATGIGKSWLLAQTQDYAEQLGLKTAGTRFFDINYNHENGMRDLLLDIVKPEDTVPRNKYPDVIADHFFKNNVKFEIYLAILYILFELPLPKRCRYPYSMLSPLNRERLHTSLVVDIIYHSATNENYVLLFDDVHLASPLAQSILKSLIAKVNSDNNSAATNLFLIFTSDEPDQFPELIINDDHSTLIELDSLPATERKAIYPLTSGRDRDDLLYLKWANCLEKTGVAAYPDTLENLLTLIIDRLDLKDKRAIQAGSVLGMRFSLDALNALIDEPQYDPIILIKAGFLELKHHYLEFCHQKIRQCIYQLIDTEQCQSMHRRAASYYLFGNHHLNAYHLEASGSELASKAYVSAAIAANSEYRVDLANYYFEKALACARSKEDKYFSAMQEGEALLGSERVATAIQAFDRAQQLAGDLQQQALAWLGMATALIQRKQYLAASSLLERCETILVQEHVPENLDHKPPYHETLAKYFYYRSSTALHMNSADTAMRFIKIALEHARQSQSSYWLTTIALQLARIESNKLQFVNALSTLQLAVNIARENNHGYLELQALLLLAHIKLLQADFSGSAKDLEYVMTQASMVGDHHLMLDVLSVLCFSDFVKAQFNHLQQHAELASELYKFIDTDQYEQDINNYRLLAYYYLGRHQDVKQQFQRTKSSIHSPIQDQSVNYLPWNLAPIMALIEDEAETAAEYLNIAIRDIERLNGPIKLECCFIAVEATIKHRLWEQAEDLADTIIMALTNEILPFFVCCAERVRILSRIDQGQLSQSTRAELVDILATEKQLGLTIHLAAYEDALKVLKHRTETV